MYVKINKLPLTYKGGNNFSLFLDFVTRSQNSTDKRQINNREAHVSLDVT